MIDIKRYRVFSSQAVSICMVRGAPASCGKLDEHRAGSQWISGRSFSSFECKPVVTSPEMILNVMRDANNDTHCVGVITWMHTFSPRKCG